MQEQSRPGISPRYYSLILLVLRADPAVAAKSASTAIMIIQSVFPCLRDQKLHVNSEIHVNVFPRTQKTRLPRGSFVSARRQTEYFSGTKHSDPRSYRGAHASVASAARIVPSVCSDEICVVVLMPGFHVFILFLRKPLLISSIKSKAASDGNLRRSLRFRGQVLFSFNGDSQ
jgi:hypothetical protein